MDVQDRSTAVSPGGSAPAVDELELKYRTWLEAHPEALEDVATAFVREHPASGSFVKRTTGGEVQISKDEFEVRQWVLMHPDVLVKIRGVAR